MNERIFETEPHNREITNPEILWKEFWLRTGDKKVVERMSAAITAHPTYDKKQKKDLVKRIPEELEKEKKFTHDILMACARWAQEQKALVLWDLDETIGRYDTSDNLRWKFRVSIFELMELLKKQFPGLHHGILSDDARENIVDDQKGKRNLSRFLAYVDQQHVYSSRTIEFESQEDLEEQEMFKKMAREKNCNYSPGVLKKMKKLADLKKEGFNVKIIDDNDCALLQGGDGVSTKALRPEAAFMAVE